MPGRTIQGAAGYLPLLRLDKKAIRSALGWSGLGGGGKGRRAVAGWDEDALTMAVEAARPLVDGAASARLTFASTSAPFLDRSQAGIAVEALNLARETETIDVSGTRRCAVSALRRALENGAGDEIIIAGEKRLARPGSAQSAEWGDGGGSVRVGDGKGIARLLGAASVNADLLDVYTTSARRMPYASEERFVRDQAVAEIYVPALGAALSAAGLNGGDIKWSVVPEPVGGTYAAVAKALKLTAPNLCTEVAVAAGELGAAMPLFGLALALERASPGDRILLAGFGNGCDALVLEMTGQTASKATQALLDQGAVLDNYARFLNLTGNIDLEWGPRSEVNQKTSASVLLRHGRDMHGFIGGRDARGNVQFPKTPIPVSPDHKGPETYEDIRLADSPAKVLSITADRLNFTPDPPFYFGLIQFENGARVAMEMCDLERGAPAVGDPMRMRFRIKAIDRQRDFRTYFWKAAPLERPALPVETK